MPAIAVSHSSTPTPTAGSRAYFACAIAAFGAFLFGYDAGTFSGAQIFVRRHFHMIPLVFGVMTSALMLGWLLATTLPPDLAWRWLLGSTAVPSVVLLRKIPRELLESALNNPQQILPKRGNKKVYQSQLDFDSGKVFLLRVIVDDTVDPAAVVTVYRTSKISKYWRQP